MAINLFGEGDPKKKEKRESDEKVKHFFKSNDKELKKYFDSKTIFNLRQEMAKISYNQSFEEAMDYINNKITEAENKQNFEKEEEEKVLEFFRNNSDNELLKSLTFSEKRKVKDRMIEIAKKDGFDEAVNYLESTTTKFEAFVDKKKDYALEVKYADKLYKTYVDSGISRLDKINGRFLAAQNLKLDMIIDQNEKIIELLEKLVEK